MVKCVFCGKETVMIRGVHFIGNDGVVSFFCSSKCRKNELKLKRDKRRLKWTAAYREEKEKLAVRETEMKKKAASKAHETKSKEHTNVSHEHHETKAQPAVHDKKKK